jgi:site-specific DNA-methyltransferase (adenine-specific)
MAGMADKPDGYFDLAIVDPPYGIGMDNQKVRTKPNRPNTYLRKGEYQYLGGGWDDEQPNAEYFKQLFRVSRNQIIWGANYFCEFLPSGFGWIFWDKQMGENQFSAGEFAFQSIQIKSAMFSHPSMRVQNTRIHPTQKPVALYDWILQNYAKEGDLILDTHVGSGSSRIAAYKGGFNFVGFEIDPEYYALQEARFREFVMNIAPADLEPVTRHGQIKLF